ncbi:MAG TPA: hypothetical protein VGS02_20635 [Acidobacteriaceae bacterium]|nr:hypothetical protein [Acidobacteriaceae bacterium]
MNPLVRRSLASGAGLALAFCGGAWGIAQTPSSTPTQAPPAQTQPAPPAQTTPPNSQTQTMPGAAQSPAPNTQAAPGSQAAPAQPQTRTLQMVEVKAELQKTLDAKKAKQGEPVMAKLQDDANIPNQQMLPKNTVLEGHVDQTQVSPDKKGTSSVTVTFDKAKLKSGQELPIKATVVALQQPQNNMVPAGGGAPAGAGAPTESPSGGAPGGGSATPGGGSAGPSGGGAPMPSQQMPNDTGAGYSGQGGQVPGIQLKSDIHQQSSATFLASGKNVHIPDGTQMEVALTIIPPGTHLQ